MKKKTCPRCEKGKLVEADDIISEIYGYIFVEKGERCTKCGEEYPFEHEAQKTIEVARKLGVWPEPLKLHRRLSKSGRYLILKLPADIKKQMKLHAGEEVAIGKLGNKVIIEPLEK